MSQKNQISESKILAMSLGLAVLITLGLVLGGAGKAFKQPDELPQGSIQQTAVQSVA